MEAPGYLRPAMVSDLIDGTCLVENRIYFEKHADGHLTGPYIIDYPDTWIKEMYTRIQLSLVYVPHYEAVEGSLRCMFHFKEASTEDFVFRGHWVFNHTYFLMRDGLLYGPFILKPTTILSDFKLQLQEKRVFVMLLYKYCIPAAKTRNAS